MIQSRDTKQLTTYISFKAFIFKALLAVLSDAECYFRNKKKNYHCFIVHAKIR